MKNLKNNKIGYTGKVTILYQDSNGRYRLARKKNSGKLPLFTFLTYALQGTYMKDLAPRYLNGLYVTRDANTDEVKAVDPAFFQKVILSKTPTRKNSSNESNINSTISDTVEYCFSVNPSIFIPSDLNEINRLQLLNSCDRDNICAEIDLPKNCGISNASITNIMVYWTLRFDNITEVDSDDGAAST